VVRFEWVTKRPVEPNLVDVVAALLVPDHISGFDQIRDDAVDSPLADSDQASHVHKTDFWVLGDAQQNVGVVGEKCPRRDLGVSALGAEFHELILLRLGISSTG
jgi:hypothetical protein